MPALMSVVVSVMLQGWALGSYVSIVFVALHQHAKRLQTRLLSAMGAQQ